MADKNKNRFERTTVCCNLELDGVEKLTLYRKLFFKKLDSEDTIDQNKLGLYKNKKLGGY